MRTDNKSEKPNFVSEGPKSTEEIKSLVADDLNKKYNLHDQEMLVKDLRHKELFGSALSYYAGWAPPVGPNYGIKLLAGQQALTNLEIVTDELNIFFMGTGGALHFAGKHKDVYEGGDVLCNLGLHKGIAQKQPTFLLRGVGTADFDSATHYYNELFDKNPHAPTGGPANESVLGSNANIRLAIAMEQFFIPTLLQMITKKLKQGIEHAEFVFNIVGHSRGAICSYAFCDLIDLWMKTLPNIKIDNLASQISIEYKSAVACKNYGGNNYSETILSKEEITQALKAICQGNMTFKTKLMIYDPVEGRAAFGDSYTSKFTLSIFGTKYTCDYAGIPPSVMEAQIFLALDERREAFQPTIAQVEDKTETTLKIIPVIGVHGTLKGYFSKFDDSGQYSYVTTKHYNFLKEALRASVDLVKVKSTTFLFDVLPPFDKITFYNVFYSNDGAGYTSTKKHFLECIDTLIANPTDKFLQFLQEKLNTTPDQLGNNLKHSDLIALCEWIMLSDQTIASKLYFDMEKDINTLYLCPNDIVKSKKINLLRKEMRQDLMPVVNDIPMFNQDMHESRYIWNRDKKLGNSKQIMLTKHYTHLSHDPTTSIWYPKSTDLNRKADIYFEDSFYFNLLDAFDYPELEGYSSEDIKCISSLSYDFADLNEKGVVFMLNPDNSTAQESYHKCRQIVKNHLNEADISKALKNKINAVLLMKEKFQYNIPIDYTKDSDYPEILKAVGDYQLKAAFKLVNNPCFNQNPRLYLEIYKLLLSLKSINSDAILPQCKELETILKSTGLDIVKTHLIKELLSWQKVIGEFEENKTVSFKKEINDSNNELSKLKKSEVSLSYFERDKGKIDKQKEIASSIEALKITIQSAEKSLKAIPQLVGKFDKINNLIEDFNALSGSLDEQINSLQYIEISMLTLIKDQINLLGLPIFESQIIKVTSGSNTSQLEQELQHTLFLNDKFLYKEKLNKAFINASDSKSTIQLENERSIISNSKQCTSSDTDNNNQCSFSLFKSNAIGPGNMFLKEVKENNVDKMRALLEAFKNAKAFSSWHDFTSEAVDAQGNTSLHLIAENKDQALWNVVENCQYANYKTHAVFNFTKKNNEGLTPLEVAVKAGNVDIVIAMKPIYISLDKTNYTNETFKISIKLAKINHLEGNENRTVFSKI